MRCPESRKLHPKVLVNAEKVFDREMRVSSSPGSRSWQAMVLYEAAMFCVKLGESLLRHNSFLDD